MGIQSLLSDGLSSGLEGLGVGNKTAGSIGSSLAPLISNAAIGAALGGIGGNAGTGAVGGLMNGLLHDSALSSLINGAPDESVSVTGRRGSLTDPTVQNSILANAANKGSGGNGLMGQTPYSQLVGGVLAALQAASRPKEASASSNVLSYAPTSSLRSGLGAGFNFAHGGALNSAINQHGDGHLVQGPGGGQDDLVPAHLSPGEWVADSNFVSALGDGNNEEGARRLYAMRRQVMRDKGMKHDVPPKLEKSPLQYLKEVS